MTNFATYLATIFAEMRARLLKFSQRRLRARAEGASSHQEGFFSEELFLSASILFLPVLYMTAALALLSGVGLGRWVFPTGLLLWAAAVVMLHRKERWQRLVITLLLLLAAFVLVAWGLSFALDRGWDSRVYHSQAILFLLEGVNPYHYPTDWRTYPYPAAHWLLSASLMFWTQVFGASFSFTIVAVLAAFLCVRRFFATLPKLSRFWRNVLAFLLVVNPMSALSFFTHHVDGLLVSTLLSVFLLMLCFVSEDRGQSRTTRRRTALYVVALLVLLVNLKFTGLVFGGVLGLTALAYGVRRGASRRTLLRLAGLGSGATILGAALFGFFPYTTNAYHHGNPVHPFYPAILFGEEVSKKYKQKVVFHQANLPVFSGKSQYERWWISLFSQRGERAVPLPPFSSTGTFSFLYGFGSFFSGALLLCLTLVFFVRHRGAWIVLAGVVASILLFGVGFSFRHAPQNWWLPLLFLVFLLAPDDRKNLLSRAPRAQAPRVLVLVIVACLFYVSFHSVKFHGGPAIKVSRIVRQAERQGGWFVTPDLRMIKILTRWNQIFGNQVFVDYYNSGLSGVRLPTLSECPKKAKKRTLLDGLVLCRP